MKLKMDNKYISNFTFHILCFIFCKYTFLSPKVKKVSTRSKLNLIMSDVLVDGDVSLYSANLPPGESGQMIFRLG